jgi:hypothetical protein
MKVFKKFGEEQVPDLAAYVKDYVSLHKDVTIMVGCDAADSGWYLRYCTVVLLRHEGKGAHFLFYKDSVKKSSPKKLQTPDEIFMKIWGEVERIFEVAEYLETELTKSGVYEYARKPGYKLVETHVDINPDPHEGSHLVYNAATGFFSGSGYIVKAKPWAWASTCAADMLLR